jgi:hypothetical protein
MLRAGDRGRDAEGENPAPRVDSIGAELERVRLARRVSQLEVVIERLKERVRAADAGQVERAGLKRAIGDFHDELDQMRARLAKIAVPHGGVSLVEPAVRE